MEIIKHKAMTNIIAYDSRGGVAYHFSTPRNLTPEEIDHDLDKWGIDKEKHTVLIERE